MLNLTIFIGQQLSHICCNVHISLDIVNIHFMRRKSLIYTCMNHFQEQNQNLLSHCTSYMCCYYHKIDTLLWQMSILYMCRYHCPNILSINISIYHLLDWRQILFQNYRLYSNFQLHNLSIQE